MNGKPYNLLYLQLLFTLVIIFSGCSVEEDIISATYPEYVFTSVTIGTQIWMVENLKTTMLNDSASIPLVESSSVWGSLDTPGYCWYNNDEKSNKDVYGALYNNYAIMTSKLCPVGWHVPSKTEWNILTDYLGGLNIAGGKLKEMGLGHWDFPNTGASNESGFTALPGGYRNFEGNYSGIHESSQWWTSTEDGSFRAWQLNLHTNYNSAGKECLNNRNGFSVRCVKD